MLIQVDGNSAGAAAAVAYVCPSAMGTTGERESESESVAVPRGVASCGSSAMIVAKGSPNAFDINTSVRSFHLSWLFAEANGPHLP